MLIDFTQGEKRLLIVFFALDPAFQQKVKSVPPALDGWNPVQERPYRVLWKAIDAILTESGKFGPIIPEMIMAKLSTDPDAIPILNSGDLLSLNEINSILGTIGVYKLAALQCHLGCVLQILQRFFDVRMALAAANQCKANTIGEQADFLRDKLDLFRTDSLEEDTFMDPTAPMPDQSFIRVPFKIGWWDKLLGGGMSDGDALLFVAPSGGGKTVLGTQLAFARAAQKMHSVYLSYEQETSSGDILLRFQAMATGIARKEFEGKTMAEMPADVQAKFQATREAFGTYLHTYDMSGAKQGWGGISDYYEILRRERAKGREITLFVVDWVQTAVLRHMGANNIPEPELSQRMETFARGFSMFCRDERVQGILLQQLDTQNQTRRNIEPHHTKAARCKSMGNYCRYAVGIARLSDQGVGQMTRTKATTMSADSAKQIVRLNGDLNRFEPDAGVFDHRVGGIVSQADSHSDSAPPRHSHSLR